MGLFAGKSMTMAEAPAALRVYMIEDSPVFSPLLAAAVESAGAELVGLSDNAGQAPPNTAVSATRWAPLTSTKKSTTAGACWS
jgi:hypothetical protein